LESHQTASDVGTAGAFRAVFEAALQNQPGKPQVARIACNRNLCMGTILQGPGEAVADNGWTEMLMEAAQSTSMRISSLAKATTPIPDANGGVVTQVVFTSGAAPNPTVGGTQ